MRIVYEITGDGTVSTLIDGKATRSVREYKGNSLLVCLDEYVAIDIETTGLDPCYDDIIEVSALHIAGGDVVDSFSTLINPGYEIDEFITSLTGITNGILVNAPAIEDVLPQFLDFVKGSVLVGHNIHFDINFLYDNALALGLRPLSNDFIDTMRFSRRLFHDLPNHKLITVASYLGIANNVDHRSESDALMASNIYQKMACWAQENGIPLPKKRQKWSSIRAKDILPTIDFCNEEHPLFGKVCVFTGVLQKMSRTQAMQAVVNCGGGCADTVSKKVNYLIFGNNEYCPTIKDGKSTKQKRAESLMLSGYDIHILSENIFYEMLNYCKEVNVNV